MTPMTHFVVQPFVLSKKGGRIVPGQVQQVLSASAAKRLAQRLSDRVVGAIAFSRTGDPATGEWSDAEIIEKAGVVPEGLLEALN